MSNLLFILDSLRVGDECTYCAAGALSWFLVEWWGGGAGRVGHDNHQRLLMSPADINAKGLIRLLERHLPGAGEEAAQVRREGVTREREREGAGWTRSYGSPLPSPPQIASR